MWTDKIYDFFDRYRDGAIMFGVPAICVGAFALLQAIGFRMVGRVWDYMVSIGALYMAVGLIGCVVYVIAEACAWLEEWQLRARERRVRAMEIDLHEINVRARSIGVDESSSLN